MWYLETDDGLIESEHFTEDEAWEALMRLELAYVPKAEQLNVVHYSEEGVDDTTDSA